MSDSPATTAETTRPAISYGRAMAIATALFIVVCFAGMLSSPASYALWVVVGMFGWLIPSRVQRSQQMVMAWVTWLVLAVVLKLAFLEKLPATPLAVFAGILLIEYIAQLLVDLRAFANAGDKTPPVTYAVTFALAPVLAVAAELFRAARTNYPHVLGVFLAMVLAASLFLLLVVWWDWTKKAFSSLKMAVTLISLIGLGSVVGTFVIQHTPEEPAPAHYDKFMNGEGAAPVNARYLFKDPDVEWSAADEARRVAMNDKFGPGQGDRWQKDTIHQRVKAAKGVEARKWVAANEVGLHDFYEFCESTEFTRIFKSWYFNALLVLLACTVVGVMIRRLPYELRDAGWVSAHSGIVFLLVCLAASDTTVRDGFVQLAPTARPGESGVPTDAQSFDDLFEKGRPRDFGWTLRLVRTSADWYQSLIVSFVDENGADVAHEEYPVLAGKTVELERPSKDAPPRYRIEIEDVLDRCRTANVGFREGKESGPSAVSFVVHEGETEFERWVLAGESPMALPGGVLRFLVAATPEDEKRFAAPALAPDAGAVGFLHVVADGKDVAKIPATTGAKSDFSFGGKTWHVVVGEVSLDAKLYLAERARPAAERTPIDRQAPDVGVAFATLDADGMPQQRAVAFGGEGADAFNEQMANATLKSAGLRFSLELVVPMEMRLVAKSDGSLVLFQENRDGVAPPRVVRTGDPLPLVGGGPSVSVGAFVKNAEERFDVAPLPPETDEDYMKNGLRGVNEQEGVPAIKVRVTEDGAAPYEKWLLGGDPWGRPMIVPSRDGRLRMELVSTSESMYRSAVQAIDSHGNVLGEHVVRVNAPFRMRGYEFYQNNFVRPDQGGPLSVFRVKYDPFVPWIYVGFVLVAAGVIVMLWFPGQRAFKLHAHLSRLPEEGPKV